jgi:thymidylate synthase ThyX
VPNHNTGEVIVLDTGAAIDAEATAMLQALHSRSTGGLKSHLESLKERGADNFMANFYVGYGHASIGDCGQTVIFIEGVSMLAAKAIQDWRLYSGQEASTRYIDFQTQPFINPLGSDEGEQILETWRDFYTRSLPQLVEDLKQRFPRGEDEKEGVYEKAINARAFDILRGFLPAGATTNLAWSTNLRQAADAMRYLRHHPLEEVRNIATALEEALQTAHPNSFGHKRYESTESYNEHIMDDHYYHHDASVSECVMDYDGVDRKRLGEYNDVMNKRPAKTELPRQIAECGTVGFSFPLDFGSFRDIQRHRAVVQRMPLLTTDLGFNEWYLSELPETLRADAQELLEKQEQAIAALDCDKATRQYYIGMGYNTANRLSGDLAALVYLVELRATRFVHPTLRHEAQKMAHKLEETFAADGLVIHLDSEADRFDVRRGEHDIEIN